MSDDTEGTADRPGPTDGAARRLVVTGTPGTGKTSATERLAAEGLDVIHLNDLVREEGLWTERDDERDSLVVDLDAVRERLGDWSGVVESHLAHHLDADRVVVLRCRPDALESRLRERGEPSEGNGGEADEETDEQPRALARKARENAESEALDVVLAEAVDRHGLDRVYEVDTTDRSPEEVAAAVRAVRDGERKPSAGTVDFTDYL